MNNNRSISIDILKFIAILLIINHQMWISYGEYRILATGGAVGVSIFFFCSGYCLSHSATSSLFAWCQYRIGRLYPAIWIVVFLLMMQGKNVGWDSFLLASCFWFIQALILYYIAFYFILKYAPRHIGKVLILASIVYLVCYSQIEHSPQILYGTTLWKWFLFFIAFLLGAWIARLDYKPRSFILNCGVSAICFGGFYLVWWICSSKELYTLSILTVPLLYGGTVFIFRTFACDSVALVLNDCKYFKMVIMSMSAITLECYIIQQLYTGDIEYMLQDYFPLNIPVIFVVVFLQAYILHVLAKIVCASFSKKPIGFREALRIR